MPSTPILGQIMPFAGTIVPKGWAPCNGALLSVQQNSALFSLLGTSYGGNGVTNFALPDLRGRAIAGADGAGKIPPGQISGSPSATLTTAQIPAHVHPLLAKTDQVVGRGVTAPADKIFATNTLPAANPTKIFAAAGKDEVTLAIGTNVLADGGNNPHQNMQPYLTIAYLIALQGTFPSRD